MQKREMTWRKLPSLHQGGFCLWLDKDEKHFQIFNKLAEDLERFILTSLQPGCYDDTSTEDPGIKFIHRIPDVLGNCDNAKMYDEDMAALAYVKRQLNRPIPKRSELLA